MSCGIYKFENLINHKIYIGQSTQLEERYKQHKSKSNTVDKRFYDAVRKYGWDNFSYEILEYCQPEELNDREVYYVSYYDSYNNGYNATPGGDNIGKHASISVQQYSLSGKFIKEYNSMKEASKATGVSVNMLTRCCKGRTNHAGLYQWKYTNDKEKEIKYIKQENVCLRNRKILQYNLNGELIRIYDTLEEASKLTNTSKSLITNNCKRKHSNTANGYVWRYEDSPLQENEKIPLKEKKVLQYDLNGNFLQEYQSLTEASKITGINLGNIGSVCQGKRDTAGNYRWKYKK